MKPKPGSPVGDYVLMFWEEVAELLESARGTGFQPQELRVRFWAGPGSRD